MRYKLVFASISFLLLVSCIPTATPPAEQDHEPQEPPDILVQDDAPVRETSNVVYEGIVKPSGISIYQQGSHRLMLSDGRFILLESDTVDLNGYVNEHVEVRGALRPTVEAGGMIMRVEQARLMREEGELSSDEAPSEEELPPPEEFTPPAEEDGTPEAEESGEAPSEEEGETTGPDERSDLADDAQAPAGPGGEGQPPEPAPLPSPELVPRIDQMASETFTSDQWTQLYCTAHIGFCIPVHRNWWFKSFGTTTTYLWHVELSSEELDFLNSGPIHVNLVTGTVASKKATDGQVRMQGDSLVGFRSWTDNRHFEISAPPVLEEAVRYITNHLSEYEGE